MASTSKDRFSQGPAWRRVDPPMQSKALKQGVRRRNRAPIGLEPDACPRPGGPTLNALSFPQPRTVTSGSLPAPNGGKAGGGAGLRRCPIFRRRGLPVAAAPLPEARHACLRCRASCSQRSTQPLRSSSRRLRSHSARRGRAPPHASGGSGPRPGQPRHDDKYSEAIVRVQEALGTVRGCRALCWTSSGDRFRPDDHLVLRQCVVRAVCAPSALSIPWRSSFGSSIPGSDPRTVDPQASPVAIRRYRGSLDAATAPR